MKEVQSKLGALYIEKNYQSKREDLLNIAAGRKEKFRSERHVNTKLCGSIIFTYSELKVYVCEYRAAYRTRHLMDVYAFLMQNSSEKLNIKIT